MKTQNEEDEGLNPLEMIGAMTLVAGAALVVSLVIAPKAAAVVAGGAAAALGTKLLLFGMAATTGVP